MGSLGLVCQICYLPATTPRSTNQSWVQKMVGRKEQSASKHRNFFSVPDLSSFLSHTQNAAPNSLSSFWQRNLGGKGPFVIATGVSNPCRSIASLPRDLPVDPNLPSTHP